MTVLTLPTKAAYVAPRARTGLAGARPRRRIGPALAPKGRLENVGETAATFPDLEAARERRAGRLRAQAVLRSLTDHKALSHCGYAAGTEVRVRYSDGRAGMAGLQTCGSPWACPVCAAKIATARTDDMESGIRTWAAQGGSFVLLTLTMRHKKGQGLKPCWDGLSGAWRTFVSDGTVKRRLKALGAAGFHRTTEVTVTRNGWHVHLHVLYFIRGTADSVAATECGSDLIDRWTVCVARVREKAEGPLTEDGRRPRGPLMGLSAVPEAQDWKVLRGNADALAAVAGYVNKGEYRESVERLHTMRGIAMEVSSSATKKAAYGSRTPFGVLADIVASVEDTGEVPPEDLAIWEEWERVSRGRRQQIWSRDFRDTLGLGEEISDEEAAAAEVEGVDLLAIDAGDWRRFANIPGAHAELIAAVEAAGSQVTGRTAAANVLTKYGIRFRLVFPELEEG